MKDFLTGSTKSIVSCDKKKEHELHTLYKRQKGNDEKSRKRSGEGGGEDANQPEG